MNSRLTDDGPEEIPYAGNKVNAWNYLIIRGFDPLLTLLGAKAHEGTGGLVPNGKGHSGQMEKANTASACGDAAALVEPIVGSTETDVEDAVKDVEENAKDAFAWATDHHFVYGNFPPDAGLVLFDPVTGAGPAIDPKLEDDQVPKPVRSPPSGCTWNF